MTSTVIRPASPAKPSNHIGNVGDCILVKGVMRKVIGYNAPYLNIIEDGNGNEIVCRSNKPLASGPRVLMHFEATVDAHGAYKGVKRTEVSNVRLYKWED